MDSGEVTVTVPLTITVRIGPSPGGGVAGTAAGAPAPGQEATHPRAYYDGCVGYRADFLGAEVPLPVLSAEQRRNAAKNSDAGPADDPTVLPYTHFSVVLNRRRSLAYYTVVNVDGAQVVPSPERDDKWFLDSRIAESEQIGPELYERNGLDRGHLVRRLDPVWGADHGRAEVDTFHFTNCAPQHEKFNRGRDLWLGLETYILNNAKVRGRKLTVFNGPVLDERDPLYKGVRLPLAFWKVVVFSRPDGALAAAAYLLEQAKLIEDMLGEEAAFDPGVFRVGIDHIRQRTGLDFDHLVAHEVPLSADGLEAAQDRVAIRADYSNVSL